MRVHAQLVLGHRRQTVVALAEINRPRRNHDPNRPTGTDHRIVRSADTTSAMRAALLPRSK